MVTSNIVKKWLISEIMTPWQLFFENYFVDDSINYFYKLDNLLRKKLEIG